MRGFVLQERLNHRPLRGRWVGGEASLGRRQNETTAPLAHSLIKVVNSPPFSHSLCSLAHSLSLASSDKALLHVVMPWPTCLLLSTSSPLRPLLLPPLSSGSEGYSEGNVFSSSRFYTGAQCSDFYYLPLFPSKGLN